MIEWKKASEGLPTEEGYYIVWSSRPFVAWLNAKTNMWEFNKEFKIRADSKCVTHWYKLEGPKEENI